MSTYMPKLNPTLRRSPAKASRAARPYHHGDLRPALIAAGLEILAQEGAGALNLREVARRAGVSHAAPYRHFVDKQALIAAIAEDGFRQLEANLRKALANAWPTPTEKLVRLAQAYVRFALRYPDHFRVMFSRLREISVYPTLDAMAKASFLVLIEVVQAGKVAGAFVSEAPERVAEKVWAMLHGHTVLLMDQQLFSFLEQPTLARADELTAEFVELMMAGLEPRD